MHHMRFVIYGFDTFETRKNGSVLSELDCLHEETGKHSKKSKKKNTLPMCRI